MKALSIVLVVCAILTASCGARATASRTLALSASLPAGQKLEVSSQNGAVIIQLRPGDSPEVKGTATIVARGFTKNLAEKCADDTQVTLARKADSVEITIDPAGRRFASVTVALDVTIPKGTRVELWSENGNVVVAGGDGELDAKSQNGAVICRDVSGPITAESENGEVVVKYSENIPRAPKITASSQNGRVVCADVSGDLDLSSENGSILVTYVKGAGASPTVTAKTQNGSIDFTAPAGLDARLDISTENGTVSGNLPKSVEGAVNRKSIKGAVGSGKGSITLQTENGKIRLR